MHIQTSLPIAATTSVARDPEVQALLTHCQPGAVNFYPTDTVIYAQGDAVGPLYLVEFGCVRVCRLTSDGRRQIHSFHYAGEVFGFEAGSEHQSYAESVDGAGIRVLRAASGPGFSQKLLGLALRGLCRVQEHLLLLGRMNANEKLATFLLDLHDRQGDTLVQLPMQRNDIADYLGLTFETVSRVLRVLKDQHMIRLPSVDRIEILDVGALESLSD